VKAQICEALTADVENRRLQVSEGQLNGHLRHEFTFFESHREVVGGVEVALGPAQVRILLSKGALARRGRGQQPGDR